MLSSSQAVARALEMVKQGQANFSDLCLKFAANVYGLQASGTPAPKGFDTGTAYNAWIVNPHKHSGDTNPPPGALVYWNTGGPGHVAISIGQGQIVSTHGNGGKPSIYSLKNVGLKGYLGWTDPSFTANRFQVPADFLGTPNNKTPLRPDPTTQNKPANSGGGSSTIGIGPVQVPNPLGVLEGFNDFAKRITWITLPSSWIRIQAAGIGVVLLLLAIILFAWEGSEA